jgi:competence protein ComEA
MRSQMSRLASRSTWQRYLLKQWVLGALVCAQLSVFALEINQANEAELDSIKGMGPAMTRKVLNARAEKPFINWKDLMSRVTGMGKNKAQQFSDQGVLVNGLAFTP